MKFKNILIFIAGVTFGAGVMFTANKSSYKIVKEVTIKAIETPSTEVNNEMNIKNKKGVVELSYEDTTKKKGFFKFLKKK